MSPSKTSAAPKTAPQTIEQLQKRYHDLNEQKIQAATRLEGATSQLEALRKEAREKYGTDDLAALQEKLVAMRAENEAKRQKYQADLDAIQSALKEVENQFAGSDAAEDEES